jgi:iron complex outermembrane recepter protein
MATQVPSVQNGRPNMLASVKPKSCFHVALLVPLMALSAVGQQSQNYDLSQASLEDLMNIQVTAASKKEQPLSKTGAAVFVITQEDIRRSGATNIPDVLRMAPGVQVAQIDAGSWAVSIRGFNSRYANKVLVVIDGRTVYSPDFAGVIWDAQDVPLEDIDRIEIIRGPGGTVWGADAVNGVISITTKNANVTKGGLVTAGGGSQQAAGGLVQYGGSLGADGAYRVFGKYSNVGSTDFPNGSDAGDGWHQSHGGFRTDVTLSPNDALTVQGDAVATNGSETLTTLFSNALPLGERVLGSPVKINSDSLLGRWTHTFSGGSSIALRAYYDRDDTTLWGVRDILNTVDWDVQHHIRFGARNDVVWGGGFRLTKDASTPGYAITLLPLFPFDRLANVFFQDEIALGHSAALTFGSKLEHNTYTGFEYEPSVQLVWNATKRQTLWVSAGRAIRQVARLDGSISIDYQLQPLGGGAFALEQIVSNPLLKAEVLRNIESGYRARISEHLSFDATAFLSFYYRLETEQAGTPFISSNPAVPYLVIPLVPGNLGLGKGYGGEISGNWQVARRWRISPGYSLLYNNLWTRPASAGIIFALPDASPRNQFQVRSIWNATRRLEWDCFLAQVGPQPNSTVAGVPGYARLDTRLGWHIGESIELSLAGQNLLTPRHLEFYAEYPTQSTLVQRAALVKITWRF